jgi:hypothetical protein
MGSIKSGIKISTPTILLQHNPSLNPFPNSGYNTSKSKFFSIHIQIILPLILFIKHYLTQVKDESLSYTIYSFILIGLSICISVMYKLYINLYRVFL